MSMPSPPRRWDPVVKLTHWTIALAVLANAVFTEQGSAAHVWVGYALAAILGLRLLWGFVGPAEARFSAFPPSLRRALGHVGEIRNGVVSTHASHNPLGALMVYAIWSCLLVIIATGIAVAGLPTRARPSPERGAVSAATVRDADDEGRAERAEGDDEAEGTLTEIHELAANLLYLLILLHIAGVMFETRRAGRQVVVAMLPGRG